MSWDLDGGQDKTHFTTFAVGVTRIRVLSEAPHQRWTHWMDQFRRSVTCPGMNICPIDKMRKAERDAEMPETYKAANTFSMYIYNHDAQRLEIMERGKEFMEDLKSVMLDLKERGKKLEDVILKVRRTGTGRQDTRYRIDIDEEAPLSDAEVLAKSSMKSLIEYFRPQTPEQIEELLLVQATSPDEYKEAWSRIVEGKEPGGEEHIQVEG